MSVATRRIIPMTNPSDALAEQAAAFAARVAELAVPGGDDALAQVLDGTSDAVLRELVERLGPLSRLVDAVAARIGGEFAARSARGLEDPLARRLGEKSAPAAIAAIAHVPVSRAAEWCRTGQALAPRRALT